MWSIPTDLVFAAGWFERVRAIAEVLSEARRHQWLRGLN